MPECEVLMGSNATRAIIRSGQFYKLASTLETGAAEGHFTFARYADWLAKKSEFSHPAAIGEPVGEALPSPSALPPAVARRARPKQTEVPVAEDGTLDLGGEEEADLSTLIAELEKE